MAERIVAYVRQSGLKPGERLREMALASCLGVSRTPVRSALKFLEDQGVVRSEPYQGYVLVAAPQALHARPFEMPNSLHETLYLHIVEDHVNGALPESITQVELLRRYDTNAVTLQAVLQQMANEGLIERNAGQGWRFLSALGTQAARRASYEYRRALEPTALLLPGFQASRSVLDDLEHQHRDLLILDDATPAPGTLLFRIDATFHETLARCSGNSLFLQAVQAQNRQRRMLEYLGYGNRRRVTDWCHEHLAILAALRDDDRPRAAELMGEHLDHAQDTALQLGKG
ncbi:GntR family transcriptional regulator [Salinicola rhizosphaerae]|uniref:GntR family transcriptional regulator n=2 Tax=Salinicola rhizosphaerae TaxID=1443141 RepID=A0ABQ3DV91_9GAMM|nr:GntR family transcriptional regulator [Salinicola rhizosphaerae]